MILLSICCRLVALNFLLKEQSHQNALFESQQSGGSICSGAAARTNMAPTCQGFSRSYARMVVQLS